MECSAVTQIGLAAMIDEAIKIVLFPKRYEVQIDGERRREVFLKEIGVYPNILREGADKVLDEVFSLCEKSATKLELAANVLKIIPKANWRAILPILKLSQTDLFNYLQNLTSKRTDVVRKKILFVGDARVGKTCLMKCFINETRSESTEPGSLT